MVEKISVPITPFGEERDLYIYLPDGWEHFKKRMPVLYMFDGHNLFFDEQASFGKSWGLEDYMRRWGRRMIVVAPAADLEGDNRLSEYCPYPEVHGLGFGMEGCGGAFMEWMAGDLKKWVDKELPTRPEREFTGIAGSSCGGIMALYGYLKYNQVYSRCASLSTAFVSCWDDLRQDLRLAHVCHGDRVFMSWGSCEHTEESVDFLAAATLECTHTLTDKGARTFPYIQIGGEHCEADWERLLPVFMPWLMQ